MTGATLVVKRGNHFAMTKVRHDGYDIVDFKLQFLALISDKTITPKEVCRQYLACRKFSGDDFAPFDPIGNDSDLCIFQAELENEELYGADDTLEDLINIKMEEMNNDPTDWSKDFHPYDQLGCSYSDYMVYIDLDQGTIEGIDENEKENSVHLCSWPWPI